MSHEIAREREKERTRERSLNGNLQHYTLLWGRREMARWMGITTPFGPVRQTLNAIFVDKYERGRKRNSAWGNGRGTGRGKGTVRG